MNEYIDNIFFTSSKYKQEREYWIEKMGGDISISSFYADLKQNEDRLLENAVLSYTLSDKLYRGLTGISNSSDYGLYMILLSGVNYLLYRYTGSNDILVGMPSFKENEDEVIEGDKVFPIRSQISDDWTFKEFLYDVKNTVEKAKKYKNISFNMIADHIGLKGRDGTTPKIKVVSLLRNIHQIPEDVIAESDISFLFNVTDDSIRLNIHYNTGIYARETIEKIVLSVFRFYEMILEDSSIYLSEIEVFSKEEIRQVLYDFNNTKVDYKKEMLVHQLFEEQVVKSPDSIALVLRDKSITYRELNYSANKLARILIKEGVGKDSIVGIMIERSFEMITAMLGILKVGGVYLPIDPDYPAERIEYMLVDSNANFLLSKNGIAGQMINFDKVIVYPEDKELESVDIENLEIEGDSRDLAYIVYTSGSTGEPKGAAIEHRSVVNFIKGVTDRIEFLSGSTILALTTICFDIFILESLLPLTMGLKVVIADEEQQKDLISLNQLIIDKRVEMLQLTPSRLQLIMNYEKSLSFLKEIKVIMVGGEVFPLSLLDALRESTQAKIYNMYGPIETTIWSTIKELRPGDILSIGKPIANTYIYITGRNDWLQPVGIPGEICIAGDGLARGYINKPELTIEKFIKNPFPVGSAPPIEDDRLYRTGDLAKWLPDGNIEFLGRSDYQVKIRGFRIELGEIEYWLLKHDQVKEAAVLVKEGQGGEKNLHVYVVGSEDLVTSELKEYLTIHLPFYMVPSFYTKLEAIPLTLNGKIDRQALSKIDLGTERKNKYVPPGNELEKKLVQIWEEVLNLEKIGIDDDIEELGGNSFIAMKMELEMEMNDIEITNIEVFQKRTIRKLAEYIKKKEGEKINKEANDTEESDIDENS